MRQSSLRFGLMQQVRLYSALHSFQLPGRWRLEDWLANTIFIDIMVTDVMAGQALEVVSAFPRSAPEQLGRLALNWIPGLSFQLILQVHHSSSASVQIDWNSQISIADNTARVFCRCVGARRLGDGLDHEYWWLTRR